MNFIDILIGTDRRRENPIDHTKPFDKNCPRCRKPGEQKRVNRVDLYKYDQEPYYCYHCNTQWFLPMEIMEMFRNLENRSAKRGQIAGTVIVLLTVIAYIISDLLL